MSSTHPYYDQTRLLVAKREDEQVPMVIAAMPQTTWEIIPADEWDDWKRTRARGFFDDDWTAYDYIEVVVTIPWQQLAEMFEAQKITPTAIERGEDS